MVEGLEFNESGESSVPPSLRYDGTGRPDRHHVNRNIADSVPSGDIPDPRPEDKDPHDESPEYGRWVHGVEGDGYGVGEVEGDKADFEEVMRVFGEFMADDAGEGDDPYRADGGYDTGIPVGGQPSPVESRSVDEDRDYMGDFPM